MTDLVQETVLAVGEKVGLTLRVCMLDLVSTHCLSLGVMFPNFQRRMIE